MSTDDSDEVIPAESEPDDPDETVSGEMSPVEDEPDDSEETTPEDGLSVSDAAVYTLIGVITGVVAWFVIPLFGFVAAYAGYQLYQKESRNILGGAFVVIGLLPVFLWIGLLAQSM